MEEENRKARRTQRREYLDNVRELVAFVKKRDKRVAKFQVGTWSHVGHVHELEVHAKPQHAERLL